MYFAQGHKGVKKGLGSRYICLIPEKKERNKTGGHPELSLKLNKQYMDSVTRHSSTLKEKKTKALKSRALEAGLILGPDLICTVKCTAPGQAARKDRKMPRGLSKR